MEWGMLVHKDLAGRVSGMKESDGSTARSPHSAQYTACIKRINNLS